MSADQDYEAIEIDPPADEREVIHAGHVFKAKPENAGRVKLQDSWGRWYWADGRDF